MQESNFDKRVQDQMEELRFRPSPVVWEKVSKELDKRKKRRVLVVFLLTALFLSGGIGLYQGVHTKQEVMKEPLASTTVQENNNSNDTSTIIHNNTLPVKDNAIANELVTNQNKIIEEKKAATSTTDLSVVPIPEKKIVDNRNHSQPLHQKDNKKIKTGNSKENDWISVEKLQKVIVEKEKSLAQGLETENNKQQLNHVLQKISDRKSNEEVVANLSKDSIVIATGEEENSSNEQKLIATNVTVPVIDSNEIALVINKAKKAIPSKKIRWATEISAGFSQNKDTRFELPTMNKSAVADYYSAPNYNMSNANWQGPVGVRYTPPSVITGGSGFSAGVIGELQLTPKSSMLAGLQYIYQSNHVRVGNFSNMAVRVENFYASAGVANGVYRGVQLVDYTNRYHFIQLPVSYQLQLNKGTKTPITWDAGMAAAYLFSTNALTYDSTMGGVYFKDPHVLKRFHLNATTGFLLHLKKGDEKKWSFGPQLLLHLRQMDKAEVNRRQYLIYGGFRVRYFL